MANYKGLMLGALIASAVAALSGRPDIVKKFQNQTKELANKAKNIKNNVLDEILELTESKNSYSKKSFTQGAILGLLLGVGSTALLTPKTGKQLRKNLSDKYQEMAEQSQKIARKVNKYRQPAKKMARVLAGAAHLSLKKKNKVKSRTKSHKRASARR